MRSALIVAIASVATLACGGSGQEGSGGASAGTGLSAAEGTGGDLLATSGTAAGGGIPTNFIPADEGAYALGKAIMGDGTTDTGITAGADCDILVGVVRDFKGANQPGGHPDFEAFSGDQETPGLVLGDLGMDNKPVYAGRCDDSGSKGCPYGEQLTTMANFDQWYRYTPGVNMPYLIYFKFSKNGNTSTFASSHFFPLDGAGFGNSGKGTDNQQHNFHFTTELHTQFKYLGGEQFKFTGDDDLWVFINKKLAIDLGGLHPARQQQIDLDQQAGALGITAGGVYALELFHAERHTDASNFRVDTNLDFVDCGNVPPDVK